MDRQPCVSGNKPFLPRTSAPSVLRLSIFLRHPQEERHTKAREKRERKSVNSAPKPNTSLSAAESSGCRRGMQACILTHFREPGAAITS